MPELTLSKRLAAIASLIPAGCSVIDVGTDHGYIPVRLCLRGENAPLFASDINAEPLRRAELTAEEHGCADKISFALCDGLAAFSERTADCVVIAGMGGETIISILQAAPWTRLPGKALILQPMTKAHELRRWLFENGYRIDAERLSYDGRLYELFAASGGEDAPYSEAELYTGHTRLISGDPLYLSRLEELIFKTRRSIDGLERSSSADDAKKLKRQNDLLAAFLRLQAEAGGNNDRSI